MKLLREYIRKTLITEKVWGPVYRATNKQGIPTGKHGTSVLYWADDPRSMDFGKYITKAKIRLNNPYMGTDIQAYNVAYLLTTDEALKALNDSDLDYDPEADPHDELTTMLEDEHNDGIWQTTDLINAIKDADYDGIISTDPHGGETEYVTFTDKQYKILDSWVDEDKIGKRK